MDRKPELLEGITSETNSSDSFVEEQLQNSRDRLFGTTGDPIEIIPVDIKAPKSTIPLALEEITAKPSIIKPVSVDYLKHSDSGLANFHRAKRIHSLQNKKAA